MEALRRRRFLVGLAGALVLLAVAPVAAEVVQKGGGPIRFHGSLRPTKLPRDHPAPAELSFGFRRPDPGDAERVDVSEIALALDRRVSIDFAGLPRCPQQVVLKQAVEEDGPPEFCDSAKVGWGRATYRVGFPGQGSFRSDAVLTAFNGRIRGLPAILVRLDFITDIGRSRAPVFVFEARSPGSPATGARLIAESPGELSDFSSLQAFDLTLRSNYTVDGEKRGYVSASCPVPRGVSVAAFSLARLAYRTDDGAEESGVITSMCRVRTPRP